MPAGGDAVDPPEEGALAPIRPPERAAGPRIDVVPGVWYLDWKTVTGESVVFSDVRRNWRQAEATGVLSPSAAAALGSEWRSLEIEQRRLVLEARRFDEQWPQMNVGSRVARFAAAYRLIKSDYEARLIPQIRTYSGECPPTGVAEGRRGYCDSEYRRLIAMKDGIESRDHDNTALWAAIANDVNAFYSGQNAYNESVDRWERRLADFDSRLQEQFSKDRGRNKGQDKGSNYILDDARRWLQANPNWRDPEDPDKDPLCALLKRWYDSESDSKRKQAINAARKYARCK